MLRRSMQQFTSWNPSRKRSFPNLNAAVKARLSASPYPQSETSARIIMESALEAHHGSYRLRSDPRLNFRSPLMLSRSQVDAFIRDVPQPVLAILAREGLTRQRTDTTQTLSLFQNVEVAQIEGSHHVHMEHPGQVAQLARAFLKRHTPEGKLNGRQID